MPKPTKEQIEKALKQNKDCIPVYIEPDSSVTTPLIKKQKYMFSNGCTFDRLVYTIRKRVNLKPDQALFCFVNNTIPKNNSLISEIYKEHKNKDGVLVVVYSLESTFGQMSKQEDKGIIKEE